MTAGGVNASKAEAEEAVVCFILSGSRDQLLPAYCLPEPSLRLLVAGHLVPRTLDPGAGVMPRLK